MRTVFVKTKIFPNISIFLFIKSIQKNFFIYSINKLLLCQENKKSPSQQIMISFCLTKFFRKNKETSIRKALLELRKYNYCHLFKIRKEGKYVENQQSVKSIKNRLSLPKV